jgi:hypothetical protein
MAGDESGAGDTFGDARTYIPALCEILGDFGPHPVFADMAAVCERATRERRLAWPMSMPLPAERPRNPDFAQLAALYCNHLGWLLLAGSEARDDDAARHAGRYAGLFAFLVHGLRCYATALPGGEAASFETIATATLLASMKTTRRNEAYWDEMEQQAERHLTVFRARLKSTSSARALCDAYIALPALEAEHGSDGARVAENLFAVYARFESATRR